MSKNENNEAESKGKRAKEIVQSTALALKTFGAKTDVLKEPITDFEDILTYIGDWNKYQAAEI